MKRLRRLRANEEVARRKRWAVDAAMDAVRELAAKREADGEAALSAAEAERLREAEERIQALQQAEAAGALADLGKSVLHAALDMGGMGGEAARRAEAARAEEQLARLRLFSTELEVLGIPLEAAAQLDAQSLRREFRQRARLVHPDLNPAAATTGEPGGAARDDGAARGAADDDEEQPWEEAAAKNPPTISELNEAYEAVKRILVE